MWAVGPSNKNKSCAALFTHDDKLVLTPAIGAGVMLTVTVAVALLHGGVPAAV